MEGSNRRISSLIATAWFVLVVGLLYFGKPVFMPLTLAILFTFLLEPVVTALHRTGLGRAPAVLIVVVLVFSLLGGTIWVMGQQLSSLANELPEYKDNIRKKISELRSAGEGGPFPRLRRTFRELVGELKREEQQKAQTESVATSNGEPPPAPEQKPVPVVVQGENTLKMFVPAALGPMVSVIATAGLVLVFVIFMLLRLQDLRNRLIRLIGYGRLTTTTKAIDEAADRISRYLLMQTIINATYGVGVGLGLYAIGLPYVTLWGFVAALLRFIPYVGPWLGALLPITLSLAYFDGWLHPLMVIGLIVTLELLSNMVMEPLLYGHSAGVSEVALLVAIAFWTWLWGPIGLVLATPLTVCLVVISKHIPELRFVDVLMGDDSVLEPRLVYYQRLLAGDANEASDIVHEFAKANPSEQLFDELLVPALVTAKRDRVQDKLTEEEFLAVVQATRQLVDNIEVVAAEEQEKPENVVELSEPPRIFILGCPAHDEADEVALVMFRRLFEGSRCDIEVASAELLSGEVMTAVDRKRPQMICIGALPPESLAPTRYICKRLRERFPELRIVVGRWGVGTSSKEQHDRLLGAGADYVGTTLLETRAQVLNLLQVLSDETPSALEAPHD